MLFGPFDSDQREDYRQMIEVNLLGADGPLFYDLRDLQELPDPRIPSTVASTSAANWTKRYRTCCGGRSAS